MARTTIELDDVLFTRLKTRAAKERRTLKEVIVELLGLGLKESASKIKSRPSAFKWKTSNLGKFPFDVSNRDAMYEFFDKHEG